MHLTLTNFRSFAKAEFDLTNDFILLSGQSGAGKTTVLMGIMFALTGEGKKIVKHGCKSCKVSLTIEDITITRTKGSNRLEVIAGRFKYEDKIAQAMIDSRFKNIHLGYVSQRLYKSFVLMTPVDKLRYIESIALDKEFVNQLQQKCKDLVKQRKTQLALYTNEKETRKAVLTDMSILIHDCKSVDIQDTIEELNMKKKRLEQAIASYKINAEKKRMIDQLQNELYNMLTIDVSVDEIVQQRIQETKWKTYIKELEKLESLEKPDDNLTLEELDDMLNDMKMFNYLTGETKKLKGVQYDLDSLVTYQEKSAVKYTCPSCTVKLGLIHDVLIKLDTTVDSVIPISYHQCKQMETKKHKLLDEVNRLQSLVESKQKLLDDYGDEINPDTQSLLLTKQKALLTTYTEQNQKCQTIKVDKPASSFSVEDVKQVYTKHEKQKILDQLKKQYTSMSYTMDDLVKQLDEVENAIANFYWSKVDAAETKIKEYETTLPIAVHLQEIVSKAEREAVKETVDILNLYVQSYLSKFAENIQVNLVFDGTRLTTDVYINNHEADINSLSGGEVARVILAFTLALAEMNNIKLLMLDESVASLDQDTTTVVIETIKNNYTGKVICIAHQTMTGIFDKVIEL